MSGCRSRQDLTFQYPCSLRFPLQAGGTEPTRPTRFPSRSGGNLKEGGNCKLCPCNWYYYPSKLAEAGTIAPPSRVR
jgi:hypothetical protein